MTRFRPRRNPTDGVIKPRPAKVVAHLDWRIAADLQAPGDWRRDSRLKRSCQDCAELSRFLDNPSQAQVRSYRGLLMHVFGRLAAAFYLMKTELAS